MSLVFGASSGALGQIRANQYGVKIEGPDGRKIDTGVQQGVNDIVNALEAMGTPQQPIQVNQPIVIQNNTNGPAIIIIRKVHGDGGGGDGGGGGVLVVNNITVNKDGNITEVTNVNNVTEVVNNITNITNIIDQVGNAPPPPKDTLPPPPTIPPTFSGQLQVLTNASFAINISGCSVTITPTLTYATITVQDGKVTSAR